MNIKQILINDKWFHNNGTPNSLQHQTAATVNQNQKNGPKYSTVLSITGLLLIMKIAK